MVIDYEQMNRTGKVLSEQRRYCVLDHVSLVAGRDDYGNPMGIIATLLRQQVVIHLPKAGMKEKQVKPNQQSERGEE